MSSLFPSILPTDDDEEEDAEICGAKMSDGSTCERLAEECSYHD